MRTIGLYGKENDIFLNLCKSLAIIKICDIYITRF